ncbi:HlyD family type I secretion periplasmic adaptor subunit [Pigmentiphaga humi]|nr:HlyD family type I secretion periplasmic adaptor subunit [Pigmentiphaga humi]
MGRLFGLLRRTGSGGLHDDGDHRADAEWAIQQQRAQGARVLVWASLAALAALLGWACLGKIDESVRGDAKVVPSRQVQVVQSLDGGIVQELLVREGQQVESGQILLRIDPTRYTSSLGENRAESLALKAKAARLAALASGQPFAAPADVMAQAPDLVTMERHIWETRTAELHATIAIAQEQLRQREQELRATDATRAQAATSCTLTSRELDVTRPLLKSGAISEVELLRLEREVARSCGEQQNAEAQISRLRAAIQEARTKVSEAELNIRNTARSELSDARAKLSALMETQVALADRVKLAEIRSPVRGTVKTLYANTVGGVVQPAKEIVEIVPADDTLLLEARVQPRDIGFLRPGQKAEVKFTAYDYAIYGGLQGHIEHIGADTITDERKNSYYLVRVRTERSALGTTSQQLPIIPGMQADVHIQTGRRTLMQYLLKPLLRAKSNALTER